MRDVRELPTSGQEAPHSITESEAIAIQSILADLPSSEKVRKQRSGLPPRTFEDIRRRAYAVGWVHDRYIPNVVREPCPRITAVLAQPYADKARQVQESWLTSPSNVLLWKWPETLFALFFRPETQRSSQSEPSGDGKVLSSDFRNAFVISIDSRRPQAPVYFDFEASWSRLTGSPGPTSYPHPLPPAGELAGNSLVGNDWKNLRTLVSRPFRREDDVGPLRVSPFFLPQGERKLLESGLVERRVMLDLTKSFVFRGRKVDQVAFLQGELLQGATPEGLFLRLMAIRVTPFLFLTDGSKVLLATLSAKPPLNDNRQGSPAVLANLQQFLGSIAITRESVDALTVLVDHRYDRLVEQ